MQKLIIGTFLAAALQPAVLAQAPPEAPVPVTRFSAGTSTNMESTFLLWLDAYRTQGYEFDLDVQAMVASQAAQKFIEGSTHIAGMNRELKPEEASAFTARWGYPPVRITVGLNALVVLVHKNNPIRKLGIDQLDALWGTTRLQGGPRDLRTWGDLGLSEGAWAERAVVRMGRPEGAGLRDFFVHAILLDGKSKPDVRSCDDGMGMHQAILAEPAAMGYGDLSEIYAGLRPVAIVPKGGSAAVDPTPDKVASGAYPLVRGLYLYVNKAPGKRLEPRLESFLKFILSKEGQEQVRLNGLVPLPEDLVHGNLRRLSAN